MTTFLNPSLCFDCVHLRTLGSDGRYTCDAYPNKVPSRFIGGEEKHLQPEPDDGGIQFELRPDLIELFGMNEDQARGYAENYGGK